MNDNRGSNWRKWDLHVHTPGTKKNDQYEISDGDVWDEFCKKIEESDVFAVGITDYFSADSYFNFMGKFGAKYPDSEKVFFPNIELCTSDVVNAASEEVNLHLIFNPFASEIEAHIRTFLQHLKTNKSTTSGRDIKASELSSKSDYEEATTTRKYIEKALQETFGDKADLTEFVLVFTAANNDGMRTATEEVNGRRRGVKRKAVITDELDKFSDGVFGNSSNVKYFLDPKRLEEDDYIKPKPVVTGCDAHSFVDLGDWLGDVVLSEGVIIKQSTWIKADLTFEGLRQIIFEPEGRVFIGEKPEVLSNVHASPRKFIESVRVTQVDGYDGRCGIWFKDENIPLNHELVAVIGNKGSGKSALADIIGLLGNSHNQKYVGQKGKVEELFSFLNKDKFLKGQCAKNFIGELHWHAGEPDVSLLDGETEVSIPENVEYLPQKYLEKICSNIEDDEFRHKLYEVIFGYIKEKDRYGKVTLEDLIDYLSDQTQEDIESARELLHSENEKVVNLEQKLSEDYRKEITDRVRIRKEEADAHENIKPSEKPKPDEGGYEVDKQTTAISEIELNIANLNSQIEALESEQTLISKDVEDFNQLKEALEHRVQAITVLKSNYTELLQDSGLSFEDVVTLKTDYTKIDTLVQSKKTRLNQIKISLRTELEITQLDPELVEEARNNSLVYQKAEQERQRRDIVDQLDKPSRVYQAYLKDLEKWEIKKNNIVGDKENPVAGTLYALQEELSRVDTVYPADLNVARDKRNEASKVVFEKIKKLVTFYNSVKQSIDSEIDKYSEELGDYEIGIEAGLRFDSRFHDDFFKYINQGLKGSFYGSEDGRSSLAAITESITDWEDEKEVFAVLKRIQKSIDIDDRDDGGEGLKRDIFKQMKQSKDPVAFYDYIFGFEYLKTKYDLKVDGKDLSELSPGERGGLLLIFYLMLDRRDIPLIIDQPEDNLDNKSVYEILVTFLKKAKKRRQIIMATHNPNLAVVADAEQIINVSIDKKIGNDYGFHSGAIENPDTNKRVVDILEGTLPAFDNRRLKYRKQ